MVFAGKPSENTRLDSWKAIAAYLGRDVSTVIRWEKEKGLPIRRLPGGKRQAVFAWTAEIDAWLVGHPEPVGGQPAATATEPLPAVQEAQAPPEGSKRHFLTPSPKRGILAGVMVFSAVALAAWLGGADTGTTPEAAGLTFTRHDIAIESPYSVAAGDLDGNGTLDLAVSAYRTNVVYSLLGDGDGTFRFLADSGTGIKPDGIVLGDLNGDGLLDAASANRDSNTISILHGTGDGRFRPRVDHNAGPAPRGLIAGDLDGDGALDLAVANSEDHSITVAYGPQPQIRPSAKHAVGNGPYQVRVADLNADGVLDLIVGNTDEAPPPHASTAPMHTLSILLGSPGAQYTTAARYQLGQGSSGIATADLNGDGRIDLAVTSFEDHLVYVLLGKGDGTFASPATLAAGAAPLDVAAGDMDGNGTLDLVVANAHAKSVSVMPGNGDGTFGSRLDIAVNSYPKSLALGDFNRDARLDIVVTNFLDNSISVLLNGAQ